MGKFKRSVIDELDQIDMFEPVRSQCPACGGPQESREWTAYYEDHHIIRKVYACTECGLIVDREEGHENET